MGAALAEEQDEWTEGRRYVGLDILAESRRTIVDRDTSDAEEMPLPALTA